MEWRCPECRTRRKSLALFKQHLVDTGHKYCRCGGYHYTHRKGSPYCYESPASAIYHAARAGEADEVLLMIAAGIVQDAPQHADLVNSVCQFFNLKETENEIV